MLYFVWLQPKKKRDERCQFRESYEGSYLRYTSAIDDKHMLGFNKRGNPTNKMYAHPECYLFVKFQSIHITNRLDHHNDIVSGRADLKNSRSKISHSTTTAISGGVPLRRAIQHTRKPLISHHQHRAKKNSLLQADEAPRQAIITTSSHRHRHSSRVKQPHEDVTSPRRRHHQSRLHEASKYWAQRLRGSKIKTASHLWHYETYSRLVLLINNNTRLWATKAAQDIAFLALQTPVVARPARVRN